MSEGERNDIVHRKYMTCVNKKYWTTFNSKICVLCGTVEIDSVSITRRMVIIMSREN